jgi:soluble lytic murein transglycosylase
LLWVVSALAACSCGDANSRRGVPPPTPSSHAAAPATAGAGQLAAGEPAAPTPLEPAMAAPYFQTGAAGEAGQRFAVRDWAGARDAFRRYLSGSAPPSSDDRARAALLVAVCDAELTAWRDALAGFAAAAEALPLVADYAHYQAARAAYFAGELDTALTHARAVAEGSTARADALLLVGDVLRARDDHAATAAHYAAYRAAHPRGPRLDEATLRQADALERAGRAVPEALTLYRTLTIEMPVSAFAAEARTRLEALLGELPESERARYAELTSAELLQRGMALYDAMRNPESAADLDAALAKGDLAPGQICVAAYHRADSWWKERNRTKAAPLFDTAIELCRAAGNDDLQVKAGYQAGRSYFILGEHETSAKRFALVEAFDHSYADDARMRRAEAAAELGDQAEAERLLASIPSDFPHGDMQGEATWRLAFRAWRAGDYERAIRWLDRKIELVPLETDWFGEGQAQYWKGRALAKLGNRAEAIAAYRETLRLYPLSFYSLLALNRLRDDEPAAFAETVQALAAEPEGYAPAEPAFRFRPRALYGTLGFRRALEFVRLGLGDDAELEFVRAGLGAPAGRSEVTDPDRRDELWAMAFLYDRAGRYDKSHAPTRYHLLDYKRQWPVGPNRARWRIAYPLAFEPLLRRHAAQHGYPFELQIGIVREESAFDPERESWANAIGLTQMIFPTAERFAKGTGIAVNRENLRDPEMNVTIGSNFLAFLHTTFRGRVGLIVPAYNAGEAAIWRWMTERKGWDWDEWEEAIPADQARNYTKRVIASYFAYAYLAEGTIPAMPNDVPVDLIRPAKRRPLRR